MVSGQDEYSPPAKVAKIKSLCQYCGKEFTSRGIPLHHKKCSEKLANHKAAAKKTRSYKFCILNEYIHEEILSFLSNQSLTKMQMITGDRYQGCEPELAKICCKCENDNFTIGCFLCRRCIQSWRTYKSRVTKKEARDIYGLREKDFKGIPYEDGRGGGHYFERTALENVMRNAFGSKKEWLRHLVKVRVRTNSAYAAQWRRKKVYCFLVLRAPEFARYVKTNHYNDLDEKDADQWYPRLEALKAAIPEQEIPHVMVSNECKDFIKAGVGSVDSVVNALARRT